MIPVVVVLLAAIAVGRTPPAPTQTRETAATATASLRGHVTRDDGRPLARAIVSLLNDDGNASSVAATTDEIGAYRFTGLRPGRYRISATKVGYATLEFNQRRPLERGQPIFRDPGEQRDRVDIVLFRHSAIEGRIVDENGDPLEGVSVRALQVRFTDGRRQLLAVPKVLPRRTDDLGRYRV
jgi:protocatechuate 3,4-dioxygenase beta subunit